MRRVLLIHNPVAARVRTKRLNAVIEVLRQEGCEVEVATTSAVGDAVEIARQGAAGGVDVVAIYGGDGTMIQAVEGMIDFDLPIGLIPGGTGNLLAANLGLPRNPLRAARVVATGVPREIDLGRMESAAGVRYFAVAGGAGFDAELMAGTHGSAKRKWGMAAYVVRAFHLLGTMRTTRFRLRVDGQTHEFGAVTVMVANCGSIMPPILHLGAKVVPDDGLLDVVALRAANLWQALTAVLQLIRGREDGKFVRRYRGWSVRVEADRDTAVQLDGEPNGQTPFEAVVMPRGLKVLVAAPGLPGNGSDIP